MKAALLLSVLAVMMSGCTTHPQTQEGTLSSLDFTGVHWISAARVEGKSSGGVGSVLGFERVTDWETLGLGTGGRFVAVVRDMIHGELAQNTKPGVTPRAPVGIGALAFEPTLVVHIGTDDGERYVFINLEQRKLCVSDRFGNSWTEGFDGAAAREISNDLTGPQR